MTTFSGLSIVNNSALTLIKERLNNVFGCADVAA